MLDPRDRGVLLEALRPPPGYVVDSAVATTFSLDLVALLTAPLAFSLFDRIVARDQKGAKGEALDSFALLQAVRQHAERLVVFCEAGRIAKPGEYRQLIAYLEGSVVQSRAKPDMASFHPKVWVQRLRAPEGPVLYRVLCLSRNLTFDRSWDTVLVLDGELQERKNAISESRPLAEFVAALPSLALQPLTPQRQVLVDTIADELLRVRFSPPEGFESFRFWPMGHDDKRVSQPFADTRIQRLLVVSPFVTGQRLEALASEGKNHVLVSRLDELDRISTHVLSRFSEVSVLHDAADIVEEEAEGSSGTDQPITGGERSLPPAQGLHAKLYVADDGAKAHVWTGSANASDAAFSGNVELLVQLTGPKARFGVEATLNGPPGTDGGGLRALLGSFKPSDEPVRPSDEEVAVEDLLRRANLALARAAWVANVTPTDGLASGKETYRVDLRLANGVLSLPDGCTVRVWPIALPQGRAVALDPSPGATVTFDRCSFQALTTFFAFELTPTAAPTKRSTFVVCATMVGAPEDRAARIVQSLLDDPSKVLRFLRLLLAADAFEILDVLDPPTKKESGRGDGLAPDDSVPLFESLVRTLDREPDRLLAVDKLVRELRATPEGGRLLPPDFDLLWTPLWAAYQALPRERSR